MAKLKLKELTEKLQEKSDALATVFEEATDAYDMDLVKSIEGDDVQTSEQKVAWIQKQDEEITELTAEVREAKALDTARQGNEKLASILDLIDQPANQIEHPADPAGLIHQAKGFGDLFFKGFDPEHKSKAFELDGFEAKTLFETTAGWAPESLRTGRVVEYAVSPVRILDIIPTGTTDSAAVVYMEETTYTQSAAETAEGGQYPESAFELTEQTSTVRKIAHFIPVTDEQLEDEAQASGYLDRNLRKGLTERLALQVLVGNGTAPNISGILDRAGIQTQAKGTDPVPDAIHKAMTKVRVTGAAEPNAVVLHPNDWQDIRLLRTTDGIYIWGSPSEVGPAMVWGLPVVQETRLTENTGLVGDFDYSELAFKRGVEVKVSDSHSDYFIKGKQAIRADVRVAFQVYRPAAFATVTGI
jgi:HK97 family phage major capsid protein